MAKKNSEWLMPNLKEAQKRTKQQVSVEKSLLINIF